MAVLDTGAAASPVLVDDPLTGDARELLDEVSLAVWEADRAVWDGDDEDAGRFHEVMSDVEARLDSSETDRYIGDGAARIVYDLPEALTTVDVPLVVKFSLYGNTPITDGKAQTEYEVRQWDQHTSRYCVPVVANNPEYRWLVMPKGTPVGEAGLSQSTVHELLADMEAAVDWVNGGDIRTRNCVVLPEGIREAPVQLCDYGTPPELE